LKHISFITKAFMCEWNPYNLPDGCPSYSGSNYCLIILALMFPYTGANHMRYEKGIYSPQSSEEAMYSDGFIPYQ